MATTISGAIIGVTQNSKKEADAITQDGANVTVTAGDSVRYGNPETGWSTHKYTITSNSVNYTGFCADPTKDSPDGPYPAKTINTSSRINYEKIRLIIYAYTVRNTETTKLMNEIFSTISDENIRYAYVHAIVGYLNSGDTSGLSQDQIGWLQDADTETLQPIIDGSKPNYYPTLWGESKNYQLYGLNLTDTTKQNIMWIEPKPFGSIRVTKKDDTTKSATPQGNASFDGITIIAKQGGVEKGRCTLSGNPSSCTISDLEYGDYTVSESGGNNTYQVNVTKTVTVNSSTVDVVFENEVKKGSIKVRKKDSKMQDGVCKTTSGHSFNGITFGIYLDKSTNKPISYGSQTYQPSGEPLIARKTIGQDGCEVTFDNLPIAKYYIKEILANNDYILSDEIEYAEITATNNSTAIEVEFSNAPTSLGTVATDKNDGDHYVEAQSDATIVDKVGYCVEPNKRYTIKGVLMDKNTGKELLIDGKKIESSANINPTTSCGSASMEFVVDARELGGKDIVVFERLYKYKDDGKYENEDPIIEHKNINDSKQTITIISLGTDAKDGIDDDKQILADKTAVVKDTISYCVKPGQKYTIRGTLIDKATSEPLLVDGNKIEGAIEIEPTEACGTAEMLFHFDATGMEGKEVVVFERLYIFKAETDDEGDPIIVHEDPNDEAQTVFIYLPPPNTGRFASKEGDGQITGSILAPVVIITLVGGYGIYRATAKKRFLRKR
jgi:hypothetical protein